jgi:O-antigen/teichoic acid export membrane protein
MTIFARTMKNTLMLFTGTAIRMVATFAFIFFAANHLGVVGFGKYSIVVHYFELLVSLTSAAAGILLTRDAARWRRNRDKLFTSGVIIVSVLSLLAPLVLLPLSIVFRYSNDTILGLAIACAGLIPASIASLYEAIFVASERAEFVTIGVSIECLSRVAMSIALLVLGYGIMEISCVMVATRTLLVISYYFMLRGIVEHRWRFCGKATKRFAYRWQVFAAESWISTIWTGLGVILLSCLAGEAAVGLYSASWRYVRLGVVGARNFTTAIFPAMTRLYGESQASFHMVFCQTIRAMCMITLPVIVFVGVIPGRVVSLMYGQQYDGAAPVLQVLMWTLLLEFINPFLCHVLYSQGKQKYSMYVATIGLVSNSVLMCALIPSFGAVGAAIASVLTGSIVTMSYLYFSLELRLVLTMLLESLRVLIAALVMGGAMFLVADSSWLVVVIVSVCVYASMLFVVQAIRIHDIKILKQQVFPRVVA